MIAENASDVSRQEIERLAQSVTYYEEHYGEAERERTRLHCEVLELRQTVRMLRNQLEEIGQPSTREPALNANAD